jgi:hypothetical protein
MLSVSSSGDSYPNMRAMAGLAVSRRPSGEVWKMPSMACS